MTRAICSTAAAAALMVASLGAQAAVETLGFEALGAQVAASAASNSGVGVPIAVGDQQGFLFSGAFAYAFSTAAAADMTSTTPGGPPTGNGYIANRMGTDPTGSITLNLDPTNVGNYLLSLSFDLFVASNALPGLTWYAGDVRIDSATFASGDGSKSWGSNGPLSFLASSRVNKLVFDTDPTGGTFGLDNIRVEFVAGADPIPIPTPVPEPASYGLVALALLGAGLASRRRKV